MLVRNLLPVLLQVLQFIGIDATYNKWKIKSARALQDMAGNKAIFEGRADDADRDFYERGFAPQNANGNARTSSLLEDEQRLPSPPQPTPF